MSALPSPLFEQDEPCRLNTEHCMNPTVPCTACVFHSGPLAKWCPTDERIIHAAFMLAPSLSTAPTTENEVCRSTSL